MRQARKMIAFVLAFLLAATAFAGLSTAAASDAGSKADNLRFTGSALIQQDPDRLADVIVVLEGEPALDRPANARTDTISALRTEHGTFKNRLKSSGVEYTLLCEYDTLLNGMAVRVAMSDLDALEQLRGVKGVYLSNEYSVPDVQTVEKAQEELRETVLANAAYDGSGTVVAVLDTGCNTSHEAFGVYSGMLKTPAITQADANSAITSLGRGKYYSQKIPFAYDYADGDNDPTDTNSHGTHCCGIAVGYNGGSFSGAAPDAQLLAMKIFGSTGGTNSYIYFDAMEDAYKLGANVISMSIGSPSGFYYDDSLDSDQYGDIYTRLSNAGVVVCLAAGNEGSTSDYSNNWYTTDTGVPSVLASNPDCGTLNSPASFLGALSVASAGRTSTGTDLSLVSDYASGWESSYFSSWGCGDGLYAKPEVSANGETVSSAGIASNTEYTYKSGTSMATPMMAGSVASMIELLRTKMPSSTSTPTIAACAKWLLMSTANPMGHFSDAQNAETYFSPRRQGAGMICLSDAAASPVYLEGSSITLGEISGNSFSVPVTLRNISSSAVTYQIEPTLMCDYAVRYSHDVPGHASETDVYNLMESRLLETGTEYQASTPGGWAVTVPANGSKTVTVTYTLTAGTVTELQSLFANGCFLEGYILFTSASAVELSAAFMGFRGDWEAAPILETYDFRDYARALNYVHLYPKTGLTYANDGYTPYSMLNVDMDYNGAYMVESDNSTWSLAGDHPYEYIGYNEDRISVASTTDGNPACTTMRITPFALRNALNMACIISDANTGELYDYFWSRYLRRSEYYYGWQSAYTVNFSGYNWDDGVDLPDGTVVNIAYYANVDFGANEFEDLGWKSVPSQLPEYKVWDFNCTIDNQAPALVSSSYDASAGTVTVSVRDNRYVAYIELYDGSATLLDSAVPDEPSAGRTTSFTLDAGSATSLSLRMVDYASNTAEVNVPLAAHVCPSARFTDIHTTDWFHEAVDNMVSRGYISGMSETQFAPNTPISRCMVVAILYRMEGYPAVSGHSTYTDVKPADYFDAAVAWAQQTGIVSGYPGNVFKPNDNITREQMAAILYRYANYKGYDVSGAANLYGFTDSSTTSDYAVAALQWAVSAGLISGMGNATLAPQGSATRAQFASIVTRFINAYWS